MQVKEFLRRAGALLGKEVTVEGKVISHSGLNYLVDYGSSYDEMDDMIFIALDRKTSVETLRYIQANDDRPRPFHLYITGIVSTSKYAPALTKIKQVSIYVPPTRSNPFSYVEFHRPDVTYDGIGFSKLPCLTVEEVMANPDEYWLKEIRVRGLLTTMNDDVYIADRNYLAVDELNDALFRNNPQMKELLAGQQKIESLELLIERQHAICINREGLLSHISIQHRFGRFNQLDDSQVVGMLIEPPQGSDFFAELINVETIATKSGSVITVWDVS